MRSSFFLLATILILSSCKKKHTTEPFVCTNKCTIFGVYLLLSHEYAADEMDTVQVRKYNAGTSFATELEDELLTMDDTVKLSPGYQIQDIYYPYTMDVGYDYEVSIPATGQVFRITDIRTPDDSTGGCAGNGKTAGCSAFVSKYTVTGGKFSDVGVWNKDYNYGHRGVVLGK